MTKPDVATTPAVSARMARQKARDTAPEMAIRRLLHSRGWRYRTHLRVLGSSRRFHDIVFTRRRVIVDVHGCFWHGCTSHFASPKTHSTFWKSKIETNRRRDAQTADLLAADGWTYLVVWEHEPVEDAAARVESALRSAMNAPTKA